MPSWWGKFSSKETKKKASKESFIDVLHRKFKTSSEGKPGSRSGGSRRHCDDSISENGVRSPTEPRSPSPSEVARCQSFAERPHAQPPPLPNQHPSSISRADSEISISSKSRLAKGSKPSLFLPLPKPGCMRGRLKLADLDGDLVTASFSSESSADRDEPADSRPRSPLATDSETGTRTAAGSPSSMMLKNQSSTFSQVNSRHAQKPENILGNHMSSTPPKQRPLRNHVPNLQIPPHGAFCSAPDSSMSSPSKSPLRAFGTEQVLNSAFWAGKPYSEVNLVGSGNCSSPGSGHNSGHNSMGGDMSGQLFWQPSRGSPEYSPIPSPRMSSPGPSSRIHSGAVTPIHPRAGGTPTESQTGRVDDGKQQSHRLPLPPLAVTNSMPYSHSNSAATSPSMPRSPGRADNPMSPGSRWKKGKLLGRGTFGDVYLGFNCESGEMCAMKEVTLFKEDAKSKENCKQLMQEITLLSRLRHPNIVQYYGSETLGNKLYIYLEFVSGGSIYKLLQEHGKFGELAIRSYTQQILSGLAYLHAKNTVHRGIKGANILVDPNGRVKLVDFGMAKHISGKSCPLSFKGSPNWSAPEVIKNNNGCNLAADIWSLGCTVLEMATTKPPWSQYEGVAVMFKIGNSKELPTIPSHLSSEGKDFVRKCLQRNPQNRPSASELLDHPFVKCATPLERSIPGPQASDHVSGIAQGSKALGIGQGRNLSTSDSDRLSVHSSRVSKTNSHASEIDIPRNISCPVSPIGSPLLRSRSPQHMNGRMSPSPISSPQTASGASTPINGGSGAIPFGNNLVDFQEGLGSLPMSSNGVNINGPAHHDSDVAHHDPRNISCPVSPIGSPLLRSRSPQHMNGRMSPSPISSPRTASGASTPINGGSGAIPFSNNSVDFQEGLRSLPMSSNGVNINGPADHDSDDIFRGMQRTSYITLELVPSENDVMGRQLARLPRDKTYDVQSVLANRVCRQLPGDHVKINPSLDLSPNSSFPSRRNGF